MSNEKIKLNLNDYRDRVYACWIGKNIGGTMGGPFEGTHDMPKIDGFITAPGKPLPNDDLDLQLVWLHAMENLGIKNVNASTLGELWLSYITADWSEYGVAKVNMKNGIMPSMSGDYQNAWADSNGAWIRTEIWASLMPGCPELAAKYAIEDAKVDHGCAEGTVSSAFVAFMQSSAFVIHDLRKCIDLALAAIPEDSRTATSVRLAIECYENSTPFRDARNLIQNRNSDIGDGWFEAPSNVAYTVLGMLYGEGDFKKSLILAIQCGDDTDCTAATVGATLGILGGTKVIPEDLKTHIGDDIITIAIDKTSVGSKFPKTCRDLTDRVVKLAPHILFALEADVELSLTDDAIPDDIEKIIADKSKGTLTSSTVKPDTVKYTSTLFSADAEFEGGPDILPTGTKNIKLTFNNNISVFDAENYSLSFRWWLPEGFKVDGPSGMILRNVVYVRYGRFAREAEFKISCPECIDRTNRCVLEVTAEGRPTPLYIPIVLLG